MYYLVGVYVRLGPTMSDPEHSLLVSEEYSNKLEFFSMNRGHGRKLHIHIWRIVSPDTGLLDHIHSEQFSPLWTRFMKFEKDLGR